MDNYLEKILVIDDEESVRFLFREELEYEGYKVVTAAGGAEGLRLAAKEKPDLVILDVKMPDIDGFEVLEKIKERNIATRVIITTGYPDIKDVIRLVRAGACNYVPKSPDLTELKNAIKRALEIEEAINLRISNPVPILFDLLGRAEKLEKENEVLLKEEIRLRKTLSCISSVNQIENVIQAWRPIDCRSEKDFEKSLYDYFEKNLIGKDTTKQFGLGRSRVDLAVKREVFIEIKKNLQNTGQLQRLIGQLEIFSKDLSNTIIIICGKIDKNLLKQLNEKINIYDSDKFYCRILVK